ncbi:MAG: peptide ABC transporter substrate-binding protein [Bryobacteraceae bacterium]
MRIPRRSLLAAGPLALAGCGRSDAKYFGNTAPPTGQRLVFETLADPGTLDPTLTVNGPGEQYLIPALFEGLTAYHPITAEPMAALATHFELSAEGTRYTFFLRGHPSPRGTGLLTSDDLPVEFTRGRRAAPIDKRAQWSDGRPITAHDFVYSWRRAIEPKTAAPYAYLLYEVRNAREINTTRKLSPDQLGIRAIDDFTLEVDLASPAPYFLQLTASSFLAAVPMHAIEAAGSAWTSPRGIATSGPFTLAESRPHDRVRLVKNPHYYDAGHVALDEIQFVPFSDQTTLLHYYKAGEAHSTTAINSPLLEGLRGKSDFRSHRMFGLYSCMFNVKKAPFNNPWVRCAFNMAVDKGKLARWMGLGKAPARTAVPPLQTYTSPRSVLVNVSGSLIDVLAFDPAAARELLQASGFDFEQTVEFLTPSISDALMKAEILQADWTRNLGIKVQVVAKEFSVFVDAIVAVTYNGIADYWDYGQYTDPNWFLSPYLPGATSNTDWTDSKFTAMLTRANAMADPAERMSTLAECEKYLLAAMPAMPLVYDAWSYFEKPYLRCGGGGNLVNSRHFKYAWIDTNWRPS